MHDDDSILEGNIPGPYCQQAAQFVVNDRIRRGESIASFRVDKCNVIRKEFYSMELTFVLTNGKHKKCFGIVVWVRPFKEDKFIITNNGQCDEPKLLEFEGQGFREEQ
jgi:hypothetical protein